MNLLNIIQNNVYILQNKTPFNYRSKDLGAHFLSLCDIRQISENLRAVKQGLWVRRSLEEPRKV